MPADRNTRESLLRHGGDPLPHAMLVALHKRHDAPPGFDSLPEQCDTCKEDAAIALEAARSPEALINAICVVNVEGEKYLERERWKALRELLIELERGSHRA